MPFGMGPAGWYFWPYLSYWMSQAHGFPYSPYQYSPYPGSFGEEQEIKFLESQAEILEEELEQINKRLDELKKKKEK